MTTSCREPIQLSYFLSSRNTTELNTAFLSQNHFKTKQTCFLGYIACNCIELKRVCLHFLSVTQRQEKRAWHLSNLSSLSSLISFPHSQKAWSTSIILSVMYIVQPSTRPIAAKTLTFLTTWKELY